MIDIIKTDYSEQYPKYLIDYTNNLNIDNKKILLNILYILDNKTIDIIKKKVIYKLSSDIWTFEYNEDTLLYDLISYIEPEIKLYKYNFLMSNDLSDLKKYISDFYNLDINDLYIFFQQYIVDYFMLFL